MKIFTRIISITLIILSIILGTFFPVTSLATGNTTTIYATHRYGNLLKRNGIDLTCIYMVHSLNGVEYPAYCLNYGLDGATESFSYNVTIDTQITDMELWRTVVNGYPYKTPEQLGCATKEEAYLATRQAVYCALYQRDPESYFALGGEAGERTLNALKQIVYTARTSNEVKVSPNLQINAVDNLWQVDKIDKNYVSKEFTVTANASMKDFEVVLTGDVLDGIKLTDTNNVEKTTFSKTENFKVLIPIKNLKQDGSFGISVNSQVYTKPVLYGASNNSSLQNIAVTGLFYEAGSGDKTEYYFKNETKIVILKQDQETKQALEGAKFQILNENKEIVYSDLTTNAEGIITVENLLPGKYFIQETETLEGYEVYDKLIEVELKLNEETKATVNNLQTEVKPQIEKTNTELEVEQVKSKAEVTQAPKILPKTGM